MAAGYDPTRPGLDEARLQAIKTRIISRLADLNTALQRADDPVPLGTITSNMVRLGDNEADWGISTGPIRIRITGGGQQDGLDYQSDLTASLDNNKGWKYTYSTNIYVYFHPECLPDDDDEAQAEMREIAKARVSDWLTLGVFNNWDRESGGGGVLLNLSTNIITDEEVDPGHDTLMDSMIKSVYKGNVPKSYGGSTLFPTIHLLHSCTVE